MRHLIRGLERDILQRVAILLIANMQRRACPLEKLQAGEICGLWQALSLSMSKAQVQNTRYLLEAALLVANIWPWAI